MSLAVFGQGFFVGFLIACLLGPISVTIIARTISRGSRAGLASGLGEASANAVYAAIAAFGLGVVRDRFEQAGDLVAFIGGSALVWIGVRLLRSPIPVVAAEGAERAGALRDFLSTLGLALTSPATILLFVALFDSLATPETPALLVLGVWCGSASWWGLLVLLLAALRRRFSTAHLHLLTRLCGGVLALAGLLEIAHR